MRGALIPSPKGRRGQPHIPSNPSMKRRPGREVGLPRTGFYPNPSPLFKSPCTPEGEPSTGRTLNPGSALVGEKECDGNTGGGWGRGLRVGTFSPFAFGVWGACVGWKRHPRATVQKKRTLHPHNAVKSEPFRTLPGKRTVRLSCSSKSRGSAWLAGCSVKMLGWSRRLTRASQQPWVASHQPLSSSRTPSPQNLPHPWNL